MFKRIDHIEIIPGDFKKSLEFYQGVFGFETKKEQRVGVGSLKKVVYLKLGDTVLELLDVENPASKPHEQFPVGYRAMAIEVESMDEAIEFLKDKGIEILWGPMDLGDCIRAEIRDPDGNPIELRQWKNEIG